MAEYIEREAAIRVVNGQSSLTMTRSSLIDSIIKLPAADVVPMVRCKDCKYLRVWNQKDLYAFCPKTNFVFLPFQADTRTHFCSLGERKEGANG